MAKLKSGYRRKRRFANRLSAAASLIDESDPTRTIDWYHRCLSIARQLSEISLEGSVLRGLGQIEHARGNEAKAQELKALSDVMCPLPDLSELIETVGSGDIRLVEEAIKAALGRMPQALS